MPKKKSKPKEQKPYVVIGMATIESRYESMLDTVKSLEGQYDELHVYCNDYEWDPNDQGFDSNVYIHYSPDGDLGDSGFMYPFVSHKIGEDKGVSNTNVAIGAYCFIVGDDIIYPPDYVETMISELKRVGEDKVISLHGRRQFSPLESYYNSLKPVDAFNGLRHVPIDVNVTVLGTAYACWHSSIIEFSQDDFPLEWNGLNTKNMGDIWFSKKLQEAGIERVVVAHKANWVQHTTKIDRKSSIFAAGKKDDFVQTRLFNSVKWTI